MQDSLKAYIDNLLEPNPSNSELKGKMRYCQNLLKELELSKSKSRIFYLTDGGPEEEITNHDVKFRITEEIRMQNYDYYVRHHLAPGDSSHNGVERIQSYVGKDVFHYSFLITGATQTYSLFDEQVKIN